MSYLILSRFTDEAVILYDRENLPRAIAKVLVTSVKGGKVRLGISAGPEIGVHREEVYCRMLDDLRGS